MTKDYARLFEHAVWANRRILKSLSGSSGATDRTLQLLNHILAAEEVWMVRLRGQDSSALPFWPNRTLDECAAVIEENHLRYREFLDGLTEDGLNQKVGYRNSKGIEFQTSIHDILSPRRVSRNLSSRPDCHHHKGRGRRAGEYRLHYLHPRRPLTRVRPRPSRAAPAYSK
jgi:hypothetical protein